jgi:NAD(P) transhydrogenase
VGGGPVGSEYASILSALGVDVTLVDRGTRVLPLLDSELSETLAESLRRSGARLMLDAQVESVERDPDGLLARVDGETLRPQVVLHAVGRAGNVEGLGLAEAGVEVDDRGRVRVDQSFQTTAQGIYAAGDVIGPPGLAAVAMEQARVAVCRAFEIPFKDSLDPAVPAGIYTLPEAAMVGLTEEAARAAHEDVETGRAFGEEATELIHVAQAVLHAGATIHEFIDTTFNFPTRADAYKYAAYDGLQRLRARATG